jgi:hypothetical protein
MSNDIQAIEAVGISANKSESRSAPIEVVEIDVRSTNTATNSIGSGSTIDWQKIIATQSDQLTNEYKMFTNSGRLATPNSNVSTPEALRQVAEQSIVATRDAARFSIRFGQASALVSVATGTIKHLMKT